MHKHNFKQRGTIIHCWATERGVNWASHFAYDVMYNSMSLLGKRGPQIEKSKHGYRPQENKRERNILQSLYALALLGKYTHTHTYVLQYMCMYLDIHVNLFITEIQNIIAIKNTELGQNAWVKIPPLKLNSSVFSSLGLGFCICKMVIIESIHKIIIRMLWVTY